MVVRLRTLGIGGCSLSLSCSPLIFKARNREHPSCWILLMVQISFFRKFSTPLAAHTIRSGSPRIIYLEAKLFWTYFHLQDSVSGVPRLVWLNNGGMICAHHGLWGSRENLGVILELCSHSHSCWVALALEISVLLWWTVCAYGNRK